MKTKLTFALVKFAAALLVLSTIIYQKSAGAQGTTFTYQGRLNDGSNPAGGTYDLRFALYDSLGGGSQVGGVLTNAATSVSNGLFTVVLDFGNQFPGASRWLEIAVRTNGSGAFVTLSPRQQLTPTPYAITAENVLGGGIASGIYSNAVTFNNSGDNFNGSFVWSDNSITTGASSTVDNSVTMRAVGGYRLFSNTGSSSGVFLAGNANAWGSISDRNSKKNIATVNYQEVLDKLAKVPVARWNYKWEKDNDVPNIGPMAQDFKTAFYPGRDDKSITTLEFDGVELAAIQGLNQKLEETRAENAELKERLEALEKLFRNQKSN